MASSISSTLWMVKIDKHFGAMENSILILDLFAPFFSFKYKSHKK